MMRILLALFCLVLLLETSQASLQKEIETSQASLQKEIEPLELKKKQRRQLQSLEEKAKKVKAQYLQHPAANVAAQVRTLLALEPCDSTSAAPPKTRTAVYF